MVRSRPYRVLRKHLYQRISKKMSSKTDFTAGTNLTPGPFPTGKGSQTFFDAESCLDGRS
jgi:hypothetical protein